MQPEFGLVFVLKGLFLRKIAIFISYLHNIQKRNMNFKHLFFLLASLPLVTGVMSCKKDDDDTTSDYLDGTLTFEETMPVYVNKGTTYKLTPQGITNPTNGTLGYYWYSSWDETKDTVKTESAAGDGSWTFSVPQTQGEHTVYCVAFAEGYYTSSGSCTFYAVDKDSTLTEAQLYASEAFTDERDDAVYYASETPDGRIWLKNNLYYSGSGVSYEDSPAVDPFLGRYYTWEEAMTACPEGWHLPSDAEFAALANAANGTDTYAALETFDGAAGSFMVNAYFMDNRMWVFWPQVPITNNAAFSALPCGYATDKDGDQTFSGVNNYAAFWTADSTGDYGLYRYIYVEQNDIMIATGSKTSFRASVRCVQDY